MSSVLKGNFQTKKVVASGDDKAEADTIEARFEQEALKRLGGSIAFVAKKKVMWDAEPKKPAKASDAAKPEEK